MTKQAQFLLVDISLSEADCISLQANIEALEQVFSDLDRWLQANAVADAFTPRLVLEELFVNIAHYSSATEPVVIYLHKQANKLFLQIVDNGVAFNPLEQAAQPDLSLTADQAPIGGLGVHMIKAMSTAQSYIYKNNYNHLCLQIDL